MKSLVISDIHHKWGTAEKIIETVPHDNVIFLGDYFDAFHDTPEVAAGTADWLYARMLEYPKNVFLIGNHDVPYFWKSCSYRYMCSGFSAAKRFAIHTRFGTDGIAMAQNRLQLYHEQDGWLFTHAGLTKQLRASVNVLAREAKIAKNSLLSMKTHFLLEAGYDRNGFAPYGGVTWCDWSTFTPIAGVKQVVGHSTGTEVRSKGDNYCLDTSLRDYGLLVDGDFFHARF